MGADMWGGNLDQMQTLDSTFTSQAQSVVDLSSRITSTPESGSWERSRNTTSSHQALSPDAQCVSQPVFDVWKPSVFSSCVSRSRVSL